MYKPCRLLDLEPEPIKLPKEPIAGSAYELIHTAKPCTNCEGTKLEIQSMKFQYNTHYYVRCLSCNKRSDYYIDIVDAIRWWNYYWEDRFIKDLAL